MQKIIFFIHLTIIILCIFPVVMAQSISLDAKQTFTDIPNSLAPVYFSTCKWGDYDNDGDLDIFLMGYLEFTGEVTKIYRNDNGDFTDIEADLPGLYRGAADWGDYDNDGDLDIILCGASGSQYITKIYRNDAGTVNDSNISLQQVRYGSVAWGDYDNDGDLDILLSGDNTTESSITILYRNDSGVFTDTATDLVDVGDSSVLWGDYDNDGDLDILISGSAEEGGLVTKLYRNDGGSFVDVKANLAGVSWGNNAFGDYDNDGDLDILIAGSFSINITTEVSKLYRNDDGVFTNINAPLASVTEASVDWGDYDNDGDLDILLVGYNRIDTTYAATIYENSEGSFIDTGAELMGMAGTSVDWGDYDNDGDLDLLVSGINYNFGGMTKIYRNELNEPNTSPVAPQNLSASQEENDLILSWSKAEDAQTNQDALTYNVRIGTTPGGQEIMSAMAGVNSGYRLKPEPGNVNHNTSWKVRNVQSDKIYWSVQAIDNGYAGSSFAPEQEIDLVSSVKNNHIVPLEFDLSQNYPNPFNPSTIISYTIPMELSNKHVKLEIFNNLGQKVRTLVNTKQAAGYYKVKWLGESDQHIKLASGVYLYRLAINQKVIVKKMLYLK